MEDETVLNLTKKRLQALRAKSYSLEMLAVRTFLKNIRFYLDSDDQLEQLKTLPGVLREKILQTLITRKIIDDRGKTEIFKDLMGIFPYLLSSRTRCIELNGIMSFACPDQYLDQDNIEVAALKEATECCVQLLQWIGTQAPNVETLIIKQNHPHRFERKVLVKPGMLQSLMKLRSLKTLHVEMYWFKKKDLLEMCKYLPNLQILNILCDCSGPELSLEVLNSSLCNVKQITVNDIYWLVDICNEHLPDVEIVPLIESQFYNWFCILHDIFRIEYFKKLRQPCQRHVHVDLATNQIRPKELKDFPVLFPNVSCLSAGLLGDDDEYLEESTLPQFDNIRELNLAVRRQVEDLIVHERYLSTYGQNLQTLHLLSQNGFVFKMDLAIISKYCPKLEKLSLDFCSLISSTLPTEYFTELKELEWILLPDAGFGEVEHTMILSNVLSAPKLEKLVLKGAHFKNVDLLRLNSLIQEKQILSQLHTFHLYLHSREREFPDVSNRPGNVKRYINKKFLKNILKSACAFLPKLSELRVGKSNDLIEHPFLTSAVRNDNAFFDDCIRSLLYLFENEK